MRTAILSVFAALLLVVPVFADELTGIPGVEVSGQVDIESTFHKAEGDDTGDHMDLDLASAELGLNYTPNNRVHAELLFLYEDDDVTVDEAYFQLAPGLELGAGSVSFTAGRLTIPFSEFETTMVTDSYTQMLGEVNNDVLGVGWSDERLTASLWVFSGEIDPQSEEDGLDSAILRVSYAATDDLYVSVGLASDLFEASSEFIDDDSTVVDSLAGVSAFAEYRLGQTIARAELVSAIEDVDSSTVAANSALSGDRPLSWSLEIAQELHKDVSVAARYDSTNDVFGDLRRMGLSGSWQVEEFVTLAAEYSNVKVKSSPSEHQGVIQVSFSF